MAYFMKRVVEFTEDRNLNVTVNGHRYTFSPDPTYGGRRVVVLTEEEDFRHFEKLSRRSGSPFRMADDLEAQVMTAVFLEVVEKNPMQFAALVAPEVKKLLDLDEAEDKPTRKKKKED